LGRDEGALRQNSLRNLDKIAAKLNGAQERLLRAAEAIPADLWQTSPGAGAWSAGEVITHIMMVERTVVGAARKIFQKEPRKISAWKRFHVPFFIVEARLVRMKSPIPIHSQIVGEKDGMIAELGEVRQSTFALMRETEQRDLSAYSWRHPFLGYLNAYEWFSFLGSHQMRHEKQIREIASSLPKAISDSQK
jgi:hypothetical protein